MLGIDKKVILFVEDNTNLRSLITKKLEEEGFKAVIAGDAKQGMDVVKKERPDLILLDIMLPGGMNGFDLLEQLKRDTILKSIPVIVLSNLSTEEKTAREIGALDYIIKSNISLDEIAEKVKKLLQS